MNHIYKSIFNKALGVFTAVPEFASAHGKGSERTVVGRVAKGTAGFAASALAISVGLALSSNAMANVDTDVASGVLRIADPTGTNSIRMGTGTTLDDANKKLNSISIGVDAGVNTKSSIAIGDGAKAGKPDKFWGERAIAMGYHAQALGSASLAIGEETSTTNGYNGLAIGSYAKTENEKTISIGAFSTASGAQSIVMASNYDTNSSGPVSVASGTRATVIGAETTVSGNNSVAIGDTNTVASARTYAIGNNINVAAGANDSLVFGTKAAVGEAEAIALGKTANSKTEGAISIGAYAVSGDGDPVPGVENMGKKSISIGYQSVANRYNTIAMGILASTQAADSAVAPWDAVAIGSMSKATTYKALAIGAYSQATGRQSTVIGNDIQGQNSTASGTRSQILGVQSNVSGDNSVSIGDTNTIASARTYALGNNINVKAGADDSLAFGTRAAVGAANTVAIGANANAAQANSVALGAGSATDAPHTGDYTLNNSYTAAGSPVAANGAVSVGSKGKERQIQNVAAGVISATSTDAINGSQLYATNNYISNFAGDVKTKLGGNAALGKDGHLTMTNIGGTGKDNVNDAIAAANTKVAAGDNITVTSTTNADGSKTYTVATKKDLVVDSVKAGGTTVNADGVTIANGPSITKSGGINANGRKVTGVVNGDINSTSTDAVNGSQLHATNTKLDNVASALENTHFVVDTKATTDGELDGTSQADQKIKSGNKVTLQAGKNLKAKQTNGTDGAQVEFSLKDSISLTQVTAGTGANQVVLGNDGVQVGGNTYINKDGLNANSKPISNVADGVKSKDAVNKGQLDAVAQEAAKHTTVKAGKNVEVSEGTNAAGGKEYTVKTADNLNVTSVKAGDSTLNTDGLTITGGPSVKKDGINAGDKKITGVADGNVAAGSKDAVNGGQLHDTAKSLADVIGGGATVKDGKVVAGQNGIGNTGQNTVHGAIAAINQNTANNFNQIRGDLRKMDRDLRGSIAGTLATAGLPQAFSPGKSMVAAAAGTYRGQSGLAIGVSRISDNGKVILKVTGNTNSRGDFGGTIGAGYQW